MVWELLRQEDYIMFLGHALQVDSLLLAEDGEHFVSKCSIVLHYGIANQARDVLRTVAEACSQDREAMAKYVKAPWLQVLDNLMALKRSHLKARSISSGIERNYALALELWQYFGQVLGYKEDNVRRDAAVKRRKAVDGLKGCSWWRCPLFESLDVVPGREFLRCPRCKKVRP